MGLKHEITCDTCGRDITTSGNSIDYRVAVKNERVPSAGGAVTDMMIYPIIERDLYFCSWSCLANSALARRMHETVAG